MKATAAQYAGVAPVVINEFGAPDKKIAALFARFGALVRY
jgi:hypothetical protein